MGLLTFLKKNKAPAAPAHLPETPASPSPRLAGQSTPESVHHGTVPEDTKGATPPTGPPSATSAAVPSRFTRSDEQPATVTMYDEFGRELQVRFEDWRTMMLAELERRRDDPDALYQVIVQALEFKLAADVLPAAERLYDIDPHKEHSVIALGIARLHTDDPAGAARLFAGFLQDQQQRGEKLSGAVLTNHAKALTAMGDQQAGEAMLWQAIQADPNQENGLGWWGALARERGGDTAYLESLLQAAAVPGSWRPQTWLARVALQARHLEQAQAFYAEALAHAGSPAPVVLLQSMSGDLGTAGYLEEALALTRPVYDAAEHGVAVGNNLIKASLDAGKLDDAQALLQQLQRQGRPDWSQALQFWEAELHRARLAAQAPLQQAPPQVSALAFEGPAWLPAQSPARRLFPAPGRAKLLFLAASVAYAEQPEALRGMLPDAQGRLSRALPLFLAESAFLHMGLDATAIIPWVAGHGFAVMGAEWSDTDAAEYARNAGAVGAVTLHIEQTTDISQVSLHVVPAVEGAAPPRAFSVPVDWQQPGAAALQLWSGMAHAALQFAHQSPATLLDAARYKIPAGPQLGNYLLRLEQLLAVRCAGSEAPGRQFLSGEREIVRGQLDLALSMPESLPLRLILHETLLRLRDLRPEIVAEFRGAVALLQARYPLADSEANGVLQRQLETIWPA